MQQRKTFERGQALVLIALSAVVLFGFVALAIDGSAKFSDHRHAQNAADTAAIAGALALVNDNSNWKLDALNRANDNGYSGNLTDNQIWAFQCSSAVNTRGGAPLDCGPYEGNQNYVSVIILSHVETTFAKVFGFDQFHNLVQAVTYWNKRGPAYDGNLIVALNPNACTGNNGNVLFSGSAEITLDGGGAFVNSGGSGCGMEHGGSQCPVIIDGGLGSTGSGNIDMGSCSIPSPAYNQDSYPFPPEMPDEPAECGMTGYPTPANNSSTNTSYLYPGRYSSFPPKLNGANKLKDNVILTPGTYCVNGDITWGSNSNSSDFTTLTGANVTIYVTSGNRLNITGSNIDITAPTTGDYAGYLFIVDTNFSGQPPDCHIAGNAGNIYTGTVFAPYCDVIVNGNSTTASYDTQIIGYTVSILGGANTYLNYDSDNNAQSDPKIGLMR
jgi:Flp pilus assembly protein TadG